MNSESSAKSKLKTKIYYSIFHIKQGKYKFPMLHNALHLNVYF